MLVDPDYGNHRIQVDADAGRGAWLCDLATPGGAGIFSIRVGVRPPASSPDYPGVSSLLGYAAHSAAAY